MKSFGVKPYLFPMPVYMIGTYNEDGSMDQMAMAWGGICAEDMVALNLEEDHKTVANLKARGAFTLAVPGVDTIKECDYLGTASAVQFPDKCEKAGLHAVKSEHVDAPVVPEFPLTLECTVEKIEDEPYGLRVLGAGRERRDRQRQAERLPFRPDAQRLLRRGRVSGPGLGHRHGVYEINHLQRENPRARMSAGIAS